jgi:hypothetical protein
MGVTEEGICMSDVNKKKAGLPDKKVIGFFCFAAQFSLSRFNLRF